MAAESIPLGYAAPKAARRHRINRMILILFFTASALEAVRRAHLSDDAIRLPALFACLCYNAAGNQVVEQDSQWRVGSLPLCFRLLLGHGPTTIFSPVGPLLFMHERRTPKGARRLVVVDSGCVGPPQCLRVLEFDVPSIFSSPHWIFSSFTQQAVSFPGLSYFMLPTAYYGGVADPLDPAHFTIDYACNDQRGTIDIRLRDNADPVIFVRSGPCAQSQYRYSYDGDIHDQPPG